MTVIDGELVEKFREFTQLDSEDVMFFPAFMAWKGTTSDVTPEHDLAEWWAENQGRFV